MSEKFYDNQTISAEIENILQVAIDSGMHYTAEFLQHAAAAAECEIPSKIDDETKTIFPLSMKGIIH